MSDTDLTDLTSMRTIYDTELSILRAGYDECSRFSCLAPYEKSTLVLQQHYSSNAQDWSCSRILVPFEGIKILHHYLSELIQRHEPQPPGGPHE